MGKRPGVMLYFDMRDALRLLSVKERGLMFDAILDYAECGAEPEVFGQMAVAWAFIRPKIDKDAEAYEKQSLQRKYAVYVRECKRDGKTPLPKPEWERTSGDINRYRESSGDINRYRESSGDIGRYATTTTTTTTTPTTTTTTTTNAQAQEENRRRGKVTEYYLANINANATEDCRKELLQYEMALGADAAIFAIRVAQDANKTNWNYIRSILEAYRKEGIASLEAAKRKEAEHRQRHTAAQSTPPTARNKWSAQFRHHGDPYSEFELKAIHRALAEADQYEDDVTEPEGKA